MFNIFNIFKNENEVIANLEAGNSKLLTAWNDCRKRNDEHVESYVRLFGPYIDISLAFATKAVRVDELEEEVKALKKELKALKALKEQ